MVSSETIPYRCIPSLLWRKSPYISTSNTWAYEGVNPSRLAPSSIGGARGWPATCAVCLLLAPAPVPLLSSPSLCARRPLAAPSGARRASSFCQWRCQMVSLATPCTGAFHCYGWGNRHTPPPGTHGTEEGWTLTGRWLPPWGALEVGLLQRWCVRLWPPASVPPLSPPLPQAPPSSPHWRAPQVILPPPSVGVHLCWYQQSPPPLYFCSLRNCCGRERGTAARRCANRLAAR